MAVPVTESTTVPSITWADSAEQKIRSAPKSLTPEFQRALRAASSRFRSKAKKRKYQQKKVHSIHGRPFALGL
jgi:hypothetical protein